MNDQLPESTIDNPYYKINIEIFDGPMELLIHLIRKNKVDIHDIPIARITDQYIQYIELIKEVNIDIGGDFLVMASTLTQIKSKCLLPVHEENESQEDPRMELVRPILEYLQLKAAAQDLAERNRLEEDVFARSPEDIQDIEDYHPEENISVDLLDLLNAFQNILTMLPPESLNIIKKGISIKERISQIIDVLEETTIVDFDTLFLDDPSRMDMIITFLAILEMVKLTIIRVFQEFQSGKIKIEYI